MSQLDLFTDYRPKARLFRFPSERIVTHAHAIAQRLDDLDYDGGRKHWSTLCRDLRKGLRNDGKDPTEIKSVIDQLAAQVSDALRSLHLQKQYRSPAVILSLTGERVETVPHGEGRGEADALGQGTKFLAGLGGAHELTEYDAAHASDGGDAA